MVSPSIHSLVSQATKDVLAERTKALESNKTIPHVKEHAAAMDLLTGKAKSLYYYDPELELEIVSRIKPTVAGYLKSYEREQSTLSIQSVESQTSISHVHLYSPCMIVKELIQDYDPNYPKAALVKIVKDGTLYKIKDSSKLVSVSNALVEDVLHMSDMSEKSLLHTIRHRYEMDEIYTSAGPILMATNPYRPVDLYNNDICNLYQQEKSKAPHLFHIAQKAYKEHANCPQSIIISGESGAGKTEATKYILKFLSQHKSPTPLLQEKILSVNPLLESFGNAQTIRNDNSSRFGKYILLNFKDGSMDSSYIKHYLLEKTRITNHNENERTYHIFYQFLSSIEEREPTTYKFLNHANYTEKDEADFHLTKEALLKIGFQEDEMYMLFDVVHAVMLLGNLNFEINQLDDDEHCFMPEESKATLHIIANLLGFDSELLHNAIVTKVITIGGKHIIKKHTKIQAVDKRDALAKHTYSSLFSFLLQYINKTLSSQKSHLPDGSIGLLDIYGFEDLSINGLDQMLINYANETLQRHFNKHFFQIEQELYAAEGVDWNFLTFKDNQACLDLIESQRGIINALDDSWSAGGSTTSLEKDTKFVNNLHAMFGEHEHYITPKFVANREFSIRHYAGDVKYTADDFVERNVETISNELKQLGFASSIPFIKTMFQCSSDKVDSSSTKRSSIRGISISYQFRSSLQKLIYDLELTQPHFIRCFKPNTFKSPNSFDSGEVLRQLRYAGMMEAIRIRKQGYGYREDHDTFYHRFFLFKETPNTSLEKLVATLCRLVGASKADVQIGYSKIFMKEWLAATLDFVLLYKVKSALRCLVRFGRKVAERRAALLLTKWAKFRSHMKALHKRIRACNRIRSVYLMYRLRSLFNRYIWAVKKIQAYQRVHTAKERVRKMKDPYGDFNFKQMEELYRKKQEELSRCIEKKLFLQAADLEIEIELILVDKEKKRPFTRSVLESQITDLQEKIQVAIDTKAYNDCAMLQAELDSLQRKRKDLPSLEELKEMINEAADRVQHATKSKDCEGAALAQEHLDLIIARYKKAKEEEELVNETFVDEEENSIASRAELDHKLLTLQIQMKEVTTSKKTEEFQHIQRSIQALEELKAKFPSLSQLQARMTELEQEFSEAISSKDFRKAATVQSEIDEIEGKIKKETSDMEQYPPVLVNCNGENGTKSYTIQNETGTFVISSRHQLDEYILSTSHKIDVAASFKEFEKATFFNDVLKQFQSLRPYFPTSEELMKCLNGKKAEFEDAISKKDFDRAAMLNKETDALEKELAEWKEKEDSERTEDMPSEDFEVKLTSLRDAYQKAMNEKNYERIGDIHVQMCSVQARLSPTGSSIPNNSSIEMGLTTIDSSLKSYTIESNGEIIKISTRPELDNVILSTTHQVDIAVSLKDFTNANKFQAKLDKLLQLKPLLQSSSELKQLIEDKKLEMEDAIDHKHFAVAGVLHDEIEALEKRLAEVNEEDVPKRKEFLSVQDAQVKLNEAEDKYRTAREQKDYFTIGKMYVKISELKAYGRRPPLGSMSTDDVASVRSRRSRESSIRSSRYKQQRSQKHDPTDLPNRFVSKLRLNKAILCAPSDSVLDICQVLSSKRDYAVIITNEFGGLAGIITDKDIVKRVVARGSDPSSTYVSTVMTKNPTYVYVSDTAMDALGMMINNRYRHLPVIDNNGAIVGLLDIGKCLNDAISKLERHQKKTANSLETVVKTLQLNGSGDQAAAMNILLSGLLNRAGDMSIPTLRSLLKEKPTTVVQPGTTIEEAAITMTERHKAALVIEDGELIGIVSFKDLINRAIAKQLPLQRTDVTAIMTPNPEVISPDATALEAIQRMHDYKILTLPVCEEDGAVVGIVDVMDVIYGCGGTDGWRSIFGSSLDVDDRSDASSVSNGSRTPVMKKVPSFRRTTRLEEAKDVSKLRPGRPMVSNSSDSVLQVAKMLASKRGTAALITNDRGKLEGIVTDKDITRRVVAKSVDPSTTIASVMTKKPICVDITDSGTEALICMIEKRYRHLPVLNKGHVVGLLDIGKCLNDTISKLENQKDKGNSIVEDALEQVSSLHGANEAQVVALQKLLAPLLNQSASNHTSRTLRSILTSKPTTIVHPGTTVLDTAILMAEHLKGALVVDDDDELLGIVSFKDIMCRAIAKELPLETTEISSIMTPYPEKILPDATIIEALQVMHDHRILTLPVCEDDGTVIGIVDVMDVIYGFGDGESWRMIFNSALDIDNTSEPRTKERYGRLSKSASMKKIPYQVIVKEEDFSLQDTLNETESGEIKFPHEVSVWLDNSSQSLNQMVLKTVDCWNGVTVFFNQIFDKKLQNKEHGA